MSLAYVRSGVGTPESVVAAEPGSLYVSSTGQLYVKLTGNSTTGWVLATTASSTGTSTNGIADATSFRQGASGPTWTSGSGTPEGVVTAPVGSTYSRTNGGANTALYIKETGSGNTGWVLSRSSRGPLAAYLSGAPAIANTETVLTSFIIPANTLMAGDVITFVAAASRAGADTTSPVLRLRIGPTTLTGVAAVAQGNMPTTNPGSSRYQGSVTILSTGASGNCTGESFGAINAAAAGSVVSNCGRIDAAAIDTTVQNLCELTFISATATNTYTFRAATMWRYFANG